MQLDLELDGDEGEAEDVQSDAIDAYFKDIIRGLAEIGGMHYDEMREAGVSDNAIATVTLSALTHLCGSLVRDYAGGPDKEEGLVLRLSHMIRDAAGMVKVPHRSLFN